MKQRIIESVARSARLRILNELKRTSCGLPVAELASRLGMSYMGVKDLCVDMEERGLLDTWRNPVKLGRPQMLYRLTEKAQEFYPKASNALTIEILEAAQKLYGPAAPEKMLLVSFQRKAERLQSLLKGDDLAAKAESLARIRDEEGCLVDFSVEKTAYVITEHHSPVRDLLDAFPILAKLETEMFQRLLRAPVTRTESRISGLFSTVFSIEKPPPNSD